MKKCINFKSALTTDIPSPPRAAGAMVWHKEVTVEPAKAEVSPPANKCLLAFGDVPQKIKLLPGISKRMVDPDAVRAADASAKTRTWSAPSLYEPEFMLHYIEISSSRFRVRGVYLDTPPYHVEMLALRDPTITLPCGLRVGQTLDQFTKVLGQPTQRETDGEIGYDWREYMYDGAANWDADILLRFGSKRAAQEIQWEYVAD